MEQFPVWQSASRWITWNALVPIVVRRIGAPFKVISDRVLCRESAGNPG